MSQILITFYYPATIYSVLLIFVTATESTCLINQPLFELYIVFINLKLLIFYILIPLPFVMIYLLLEDMTIDVVQILFSIIEINSKLLVF